MTEHAHNDHHVDSIHKSHWEQELEKPTLKEGPYKLKFLWLKPLSAFHSMEFRGKAVFEGRIGSQRLL